MLRVVRDDVTYEIPELAKGEAQGLRVLGTAEGHDEHHCLYLGVRHQPRFLERVGGYRKLPPSEEGAARGMKIRVVFYAKPTPKDWRPKRRRRA